MKQQQNIQIKMIFPPSQLNILKKRNNIKQNFGKNQKN